jgi:hypothetical protein
MYADDDGFVVGYMDLIDFECELSAASGGNVIYSSPEEVLTHRKCAVECGVVEVEVRARRIVVQPKEEVYPSGDDNDQAE